MKYKIDILKYVKTYLRIDLKLWWCNIKFIFSKECKEFKKETNRHGSIIYNTGYELRRIIILKLKSFISYLLYDREGYKERIWIKAVFADCIKEIDK